VAQTVTVVDAFTDRPFSGNPAAVCVLASERDKRWMQLVAREMNLSETAYLLKREDAWALRWFTPTTEVDLCGHATLASAHVMWEQGLVDTDQAVRFRTRGGVLTCERKGDWIEMDFPALPSSWADLPPMVSQALGAVRVKACAQSQFDYLVELESEAVVRDLRPDLTLLAQVPARGLIATAPASTPGFDFVSRFFAPAAGVPEDPVTGSAHCVLAPYWEGKLGKSEFVAYQASARGGLVRAAVAGERVRLSGQAVTVMKGELQLT
jgi:predicted PhzF superfamily epimerase YddE/YHI9